MHLNTRFRAAAIALVITAGVAQAQVSLNYRESTIVYNYLYGWSTDLHQANEEFNDYELQLADSMSEDHSGTTAGSWGAFSWEAGATGAFSHTYSIAGSLGDMSSITASGTSVVTNFATGDGLAESDSQNPGNLLLFRFDVAATTDYSLEATYGGVNGYNPTLLRLQRWDGVTWQYVATNLFDGPSGTISSSGTLSTGEYRMWSEVDIASFFSNENASNGEYDYTLTFGQPVPEPATLAILGVGALCIRRRLKRNS